MGAFHAYDIRGIYNKDFDKETVYKVGFFLKELLNVEKVLIGRDARVSSPEIHDSLIAGITDAGADVYDIGLSTTPMVYFGTATYGFDASVQITASHNSKEYNGLKVSTTNALPIGYENGLGQIEEWIKCGKKIVPAAKKGVVVEKSIKSDYINFLLKYKEDISSLNIAMDLSNGVSALIARDIFGNQPHYIFEELDGTFPNHEPNPLIEKNREDLVALVKASKSDVGVIYDGDADRVMFIDEKGSFVSPDLIIALMGHYFIEKRGLKGNVLQDIRTSKAVGEYLTPMGVTMNTWKVGRAFAARKLRELDGVFGGELAGHYYFRDFFYSDSGMLASLIVLGVLAEKKKEGVTFSEMIANITKYQNSGEINFKIEDKAGAMERVREYFTSIETPVASYDFDGYRVEFAEWWFNIRPSNTEPYLRFLCEAKDAELLKDKIQKTRELIEG